jgi:hypothetical protein
MSNSMVNAEGDTTMPTFTKITVVTAFILGAGSAAFPSEPALASNNYDTPDSMQAYVTPSVAPCPTFEGYPDCHLDSQASWGEYSTDPKHPVSKHPSHKRRAESKWN